MRRTTVRFTSLAGLQPWGVRPGPDLRSAHQKLEDAKGDFVAEIRAIKSDYAKASPFANMTSKDAVTALALDLGADIPDDSDGAESDYESDEETKRKQISWGVLNKKGQEACERICLEKTVDALFVARKYRHLYVFIQCSLTSSRLHAGYQGPTRTRASTEASTTTSLAWLVVGESIMCNSGSTASWFSSTAANGKRMCAG